jgi:hypothetical protein
LIFRYHSVRANADTSGLRQLKGCPKKSQG